ncbi:SCO3242 family prenyltransferase [Streptomyces sp. NPDC102462]|uniref:SCO3242 family prenyltransferase n=1 Tax=Streptomyces sp. NPDC102462 TaxID=3366178 RepID=UPI0037F53DB2
MLRGVASLRRSAAARTEPAGQDRPLRSTPPHPGGDGPGPRAGRAADAPAGPRGGAGLPGSRLRAWAELLRVPALFTVPGDVLAGAAAVSARPGRHTLLAIGSSLCLYEAGMALNDWADRAEDAAERPHRPLPSGRIRPAAALAAAGACTAAGLALAARAGRPALAVAAPLAATVWAYDLVLKHTPAGPVAMAAARGLDLLLGAAAGRPAPGAVRGALPSAALLGSHTLAVTAVSRRETTGGSALAPLAALATTGALTLALTRPRPAERSAGDAALCRRSSAAPSWLVAQFPAPLRGAVEPQRTSPDLPGTAPGPSGTCPPRLRRTPGGAEDALRAALGVAYAATAGRPYLHAVLNPSPQLTQRAVGGGIRATVPLQAALCARAGAPASALLTAALAPLARRFAKKVSVT